MKQIIVALLTCLSLTVLSAQADKPKWAGEGGKPTDAEKEQHVDEMHDKGKGKGKNKDKHKDKDKDKDDSDWEKARKDLENNVRANNRGMISDRPL